MVESILLILIDATMQLAQMYTNQNEVILRYNLPLIHLQRVNFYFLFQNKQIMIL